ncbi:AAA family ATPase [Hymenobacter sp. ASUV-10]|uniref:AAA family ATPase n=1 Tax=Hymenobacter aranciens TaxID=3063996 RepID=A0ABT9BGA2_9BACT|nr:AAA family ATPase [Hymenobacter sp. ASUV-10]MDO7877295.1 AAA family ATPase [Hymenobacter sp. ASUV-10]
MPQAPETAPKPSELPMRLTRLRVKNFRSIAELDIPLSPLTVLVGPNGSGKSNVVDALRFVRDVFARGLDQAVMDREGMGVIQRWGTEGEGITIGLTFSLKEYIEVEFNGVDEAGEPEFSATGISPVVQLKYEFVVKKSAYGEAYTEKQTLALSAEQDEFPKLTILKKGNVVSGKLGDGEWVADLGKRRFLPPSVDAPSGDTKLVDLFHFSKSLFGAKVRSSHSFTEQDLLEKEVKWWTKFREAVNRFVEEITDSSFFTLNPTDLRQPQQILKESPFDESGRNMAAVIRRIKRYDESNWPDLQFALRQAVAGFDTIEIESVGGYLATKLLYHTDDPTKPRASYLGQESDGTIRMLGLLAALYQEPAQPFISIEEPEANIHPGALAVLAGVLDEASLRSQVLVTTHSPDMLDHLPAESFLVVEKVGDATRVGPLDAGQLESVRKRLFTPGELLRMEGLQRQADNDSAE